MVWGQTVKGQGHIIMAAASSSRVQLSSSNSVIWLFLMQDAASAKSIEKKLGTLTTELQKLKEESENDAKELKLSQQHLQEVNAGLSKNEDGAYASLNDQLMGESLAFMSGIRDCLQLVVTVLFLINIKLVKLSCFV